MATQADPGITARLELMRASDGRIRFHPRNNNEKNGVVCERSSAATGAGLFCRGAMRRAMIKLRWY
jgi:hypothetical protein